jgi:hypothetical protein
MSFRLPRLSIQVALVGVCALALIFVLTACDRSDSSARPEDATGQPSLTGDSRSAAPPTTSATTRKTGIEFGRDVAGDLRKRAEGGDVQAMMVLGRFYESRNSDTDRAEARKWYRRAADAGDASAEEALRNLDGRGKSPTIDLPDVTSAAGSPEDGDSSLPQTLVPGLPMLSNEPLPAGPGSESTTRPAGPIDPTKTRWKDLTRVIDTSNFLTSIRSTDEFKFLGAAASPDRGISLFAAGQSADALEGVSAIIRVRNRLDPASSDRVAQAATIAAYVTHENVSKVEMINWVKQYLTTGKSSEPILRNGWRIIVSGPAAEGVQDPNDHLGAAVLVEIKK